MENLVANGTGLIHLIGAMIALVSGTLVICMAKGTKLHKRTGYVYVASMTTMLVTAFMIYRLFHGFGVFHAFAILSSATLFMGMYPIIFKQSKNYILKHFIYMYWSIVGLYAAFVAEVAVRVPSMLGFTKVKASEMFFNLMGLAIGLVMIFAVIYFRKQKPVWKKQFVKESTSIV